MKTKIFLKKFLIFSAFFIVIASFSQTILNGSGAIDKIQTEVKSVADKVKGLIFTILGILTIISLAVALGAYFFSENSKAKDMILKVCVGIIVACIGISVISSIFF